MIKIILSWLAILGVVIFCVWQTCFAELVVIYDKTTKEVYSVSEKDDTVLPANCEKKIIPGNLTDFTTENPTNYKFSGDKFIKNIDKISAQEQTKQKAEKKKQEEVLVEKEIKNQAIKSLKEKGVIFTELKEE